MRAAALALTVLALLPARGAAQGVRAPSASRSASEGARSDRAVYVGVYLRDVSRFEQKAGVFDVDFDLWAKWRGDLDRSALRIANAAQVSQDFLGEEADGSWRAARWRVRGTLRGEFPLHRFPFDRQALPITLELSEQHGRLVPDLASSSMSERFSVTDWLYEPTFRTTVDARVLASDLGHLAREGRSTTLHRVSYRVFVRRPFVPVALKLFLPLLIILLVSTGSLYLHPSIAPARTGMAVTALLSCFAFQFTVANTLPAVTYVTLADSLFLIGYLMCGTTVVVGILSVGLSRAGLGAVSKTVDWIARVVLPVAGIVGVMVASPPDEVEAADPPAAAPEMARHDSARDTLRIGTNLLRNVFGSPLAFASGWGLIHEDPLAGPQTVWVERAPGVDDPALALLAGGGLRVRWRIREGARWSDGTPLTSADLAFAHELSPDPAIREVEAPDDRTFVVTWSHALARALEAPSVLPAHALSETAEAGGYDAVHEARQERPLPSLGPYRIVSWDGTTMVAEANPHFLGPAPNVARIELVRFDDQDAVVAAFRAGEIDMTVFNSISPEQARALAVERPEAVHIRPSALFCFAHLDLEVPALRVLEVRRALLAAIDRARLARDVYGDEGRVAQVPVPGPLPEGATETAHDPEAARAVLAGRFDTPLPLYRTASPVDEAIAAHLAEDLAAVGVPVEVRVVPSTFALRRDGGHGGVVLSITRGDREADPRRWWSLPLEEGRYPDEARNAAYDDGAAALVAREERALYPERRDQLRDALFARYAERLPTLPLLFAAERILVDPALRGWDLPPETPFGEGLEQAWFAPAEGEPPQGP